jgi:hypothetical protein
MVGVPVVSVDRSKGGGGVTFASNGNDRTRASILTGNRKV